MKTLVAILFSAALILSLVTANATDCPAGLKSCKVITLSPDEEAALIQQNGILDTASQGRFLDLGPAVKFFKDKISAAPNGVVKPEPKKDEAKPAGAK